jgi:hypothetical protein
VAWRVVAAREDDAPPMASGHHAGPGRIVRPDFTVHTVKAGDWGDPAVWSGGHAPTAADVVEVRHALTFRSKTEVAQLWLIAPLRFATDRATSLTLGGSLVVDRGGKLEVGTKSSPVPRGTTAAIRFKVPDEQAFVGGFDFKGQDIGLWVLSGGTADLHGAPVRETWFKLAAPARAGATAVALPQQAAEWGAGAEVIVTATQAGRTDETEPARITGFIGGEGPVTAELDHPLRYDHAGGDGLAGEVGLLTHNVKVESVDPKNRAHVFFYGGAYGGISYTQFDKMGPEGQFSRYALHFHVMQDSSKGMEVRGSSFRGSGTFWLNIHGSNGMTIVDNVGYQARGAGFYMEHPAGIGNTWLHNLGASVAPSDKLQHRNSVFWFLLGNALIGNVAVGGYGGADSSGIFIPQQPKDDPALDHPTVILHNEAHANRKYGFASWMNLSPEFDVVDLLLWRNGDAGFHWGAYGTHFKAFRIRSLDNGETDLEARVKGLYLVDSDLAGAPTGMFFANPISNTNPGNPSQIIRTAFGDHSEHDVAIDDQRDCQRSTGRCPPMYLRFMDSVLASPNPVRFGWQWDAQTRLWFDHVATDAKANLPDSFVLVRDDQPKPSPQAVKDAAVGAWVSPEKIAHDDRPPYAQTPKVTRGGGTVRFAVEAFDDARVETIEFLINGLAVGSSVPVKDLPRYAFLVARVTDVAGNVSYSPTVALGA